MKKGGLVKRDKMVVRIVIDRRAAGVILAAVAFGALAMRLSSETLTLQTTYPSPVGVYNQIVTTGNSGTVAADTTLARNAGNVVLTPPTNLNGRVGIGVTVPLAKLDVDGTVRVGSLPTDPPSGAEGVLYYNSGRKGLRVYNGAWNDLNGAPQGAWCGFTSTPGLGTNVKLLCIGVDALTGCPPGFSQMDLGVGKTCLKQ